MLVKKWLANQQKNVKFTRKKNHVFLLIVLIFRKIWKLEYEGEILYAFKLLWKLYKKLCYENVKEVFRFSFSSWSHK